MYTHLLQTVHQDYARDHLHGAPRDRLAGMDQSGVRGVIRTVGEVTRSLMRQHGPSAQRVRRVNAELDKAGSALILIGGEVVGALDQDVAGAYGRFASHLMRELAPVLAGTGVHVISPRDEDVAGDTGWCDFLGIAAWRSVDDDRREPFIDAETARCCRRRAPGDADLWASPVQVSNEVTADLAAVLRQLWDEERGRGAQGPARTVADGSGAASPSAEATSAETGAPAASAAAMAAEPQEPRESESTAGDPVQYVNAAMIAAALQVSRPGVRHLSGFPDPAVTLAGPQVSQQGWDRSAVERWAAAHARPIHWPDAKDDIEPEGRQLTLWVP
jgi:hypothetical protein